MHTEETIKELESSLIKESFDNNLKDSKQSAARSELNRLRKARYIVGMGFTEYYLRKEMDRLIEYASVIDKRIEKYAIDKQGSVVKQKKMDIEKLYGAPLTRQQIKNISFILRG
jgi:hypothetical protein